MKKIVFIFTLLILCLQTSFAQTNSKKKVYNEEADAKVEIENAVNTAKSNNKHVLLQIGGNWCSWCIKFNELATTNDEISSYIKNNYEVVHVNYSPNNKNLEVLETLKFPQRFGFPVFVILNNNGELIHTQNSGYLESKEGVGHDPKVVLNFLKDWSFNALDPINYKK